MPRVIAILCAIVFLGAAQISAAPLENGFASAPPASASTAEKDSAYQQARDRLLAAAGKYERTPYRYGGLDRRGLDCSGLVFVSFRDALGISVPRNAEGLYAWTEKIQIEKAQPGDLLFFKTTGNGKISHVGIFVGGRRFIHAASEGPSTGVIYSTLDERYWSRTYAGAGRALPEAGNYTNTGGKNPSAAENKKTPGRERPSAASRQSAGNVFMGIAIAPTWNTYFADGNVLRGGAAQLRTGIAIAPFNQPMILGLELRPEWDTALGIFRIPLTLSWGLSDKLLIFAGPVLSFGDAALKVGSGSRRYTGGTSWLGAVGITAAPFAYRNGGLHVAPYAELAWQSYFSDNNDGDNFGADLAAGIRISTGIRVTWMVK